MRSSTRPTLMVVGSFAPIAVGRYLAKAARDLGLRVVEAHDGDAFPRMGRLQSVYQRVVRAEPMLLGRFGRKVVQLAQSEGVTVCLATGHAPLDTQTLLALRQQGVALINFSTDDPWNPGNWSAWRLDTLAHYDAIYTPRPTNLQQLRATGCPLVEVLHFGYDPETHRPATAAEVSSETPSADVVFIGGADDDRLPFLRAISQSGLNVRHYGSYGHRYPELKPFHGGHLDGVGMRRVLARAKMSLCLVRRANRDEHVMRTFEEPAMGSCVAMEDTPQHRALFHGPLSSEYLFRTPEELVRCARTLCANAAMREAIRREQRAAVVHEGTTYAARLNTMLAPTGLLDDL